MMASLGGIGLYSRHLTDDDVSNIGAATRSLIKSAALTEEVPEAELSAAVQRGDETVVFSGKSVSLLTGLLFSGHYDHIISRILRCLNATQLGCLQKTCKAWHEYIEDNLWRDAKVEDQLRSRWGEYMPQVFVLTNGRPLICLHCTETYIMCGEEKTGRLVVYNRAALYGPKPEYTELDLDDKDCVIGNYRWPDKRLPVHEEGASITCITSQDDLVVTGGSDGAVNIVRLSSGEKIGVLSQGPTIVYDVKMIGLKVFATAGTKVTVQDIRISKGFREKVEGELTHVLEGHTRDVLCLDVQKEAAFSGGSWLVVTGSMDKTIHVFRLGPDGTFKVVHKLEEHKLKVRCIKIHENLIISGSWDKSAKLWDLRTGECLRSLDHEKQIRSVAIDGHRLLTGDMEGYVFAWDLENVRNPEVGSDRLCMRAHNAMDPVVFDRNTEKPVYGVHLEQAAMIQVAGCTGRVVVHDFWQYDSYDTFGLEAYMIDKTKCDSLVM